MKSSFRIFFRLYGGPTQKEIVEEYTPEKAIIELKRKYAGSLVIVQKIKHIKASVEEKSTEGEENNE